MGRSQWGENSAVSMARVLCKASSLLERNIDEEVLTKRLQFLIYDLNEHCADLTGADQLFEGLREFFFEKKGYRCTSEHHHHTPEHLCSNLISQGHGHIEVLAALFCTLGQGMNLPLQVLAVNPLRYVRLATAPTVFDLGRGGQQLSPQDLIEVLQTHSPLDPLADRTYLEPLELMVVYLTHLKGCCAEDLHLQLSLLNLLLELCPQKIQLYGERARAYYELGEHTLAKADLKRYFSFKDRENGPADLVGLLTELEASL